MRKFKLAINMAGAISAGAYTAGVLDFLTEALDAWYEAKRQNEEVPMHDVSIEAFSGASAGGMCAAISAILLQYDFDHISNTSKKGTSNRFYESWVNKIDIEPLLKTRDLKNNTGVVSLLDSSIIDEIADFALSPGKRLKKPREYVSPNLTLFLSLTNLRAVPYSLNGVAPGSVEETAMFYGDRIQFQTVRHDSTEPLASTAYRVDLTSDNADWSLLRTAAKATGAFPVFLAPRTLPRRRTDYSPPVWESRASSWKDDPPPVCPTFPADLKEPFETLNVDGGVTNNDPFNYAHDYLAKLAPPALDKHLEKDPCRTDRAVLSVAPFPTTEAYDLNFDTAKNALIPRALPRLFSALVSQSRFYGEALRHLMTGTTFSHFVIAPSDDELAQKHANAPGKHKAKPTALQCGTLSAFGGFFERGFRAHDYTLGRRNCQKFLRDHFVLPEHNILMKEALDTLPPPVRARIIQKYRCNPPVDPGGKPIQFPQGSCVRSDAVWLPIIPLCTKKLQDPIPPVPRAQMSRSRLNKIVRLISRRFRAVTRVAIDAIPRSGLRMFLGPGPWVVSMLGRNPLKKAIIEQLGDSYRP